LEVTNQNKRIDGDNGVGTYRDSETWEETSPNLKDSDKDTFSDKDEDDWEYNPLSIDTDGDSLSDDTEDEDGDSLDDNMEIEGWTVVIIFKVTKELDKRYNVTSDPRDIDSDNDGLVDFQEYSNATGKSDSDGDGKTDLQELTKNYNRSANVIDGEPPEICKFNVPANVDECCIFGFLRVMSLVVSFYNLCHAQRDIAGQDEVGVAGVAISAFTLRFNIIAIITSILLAL